MSGKDRTTPEEFAAIRIEMEASGKPVCVAWGSFYDAQFEHFDDVKDAMRRFLEIDRTDKPDNIGIYVIGERPITAIYTETEIPF